MPAHRCHQILCDQINFGAFKAKYFLFILTSDNTAWFTAEESWRLDPSPLSLLSRISLHDNQPLSCSSNVLQLCSTNMSDWEFFFPLYLYLFAKLSGCRWFFRGLLRSQSRPRVCFRFAALRGSSLLSVNALHTPPLCSFARHRRALHPSIAASVIGHLIAGLPNSSLQLLQALSKPQRCRISVGRLEQ